MKKFLKWSAGALTVVMLIWTGEYSYRSNHGSYHLHSTSEAVMVAIWHPTDFTPRRMAPQRPPDAAPSRRRYAPLTQLPKKRFSDTPLLLVDRWLFHPTVALQSSQGDMHYLYRLSDDGRKLIPIQTN